MSHVQWKAVRLPPGLSCPFLRHWHLSLTHSEPHGEFKSLCTRRAATPADECLQAIKEATSQEGLEKAKQVNSSVKQRFSILPQPFSSFFP